MMKHSGATARIAVAMAGRGLAVQRKNDGVPVGAAHGMAYMAFALGLLGQLRGQVVGHGVLIGQFALGQSVDALSLIGHAGLFPARAEPPVEAAELGLELYQRAQPSVANGRTHTAQLDIPGGQPVGPAGAVPQALIPLAQNALVALQIMQIRGTGLGDEDVEQPAPLGAEPQHEGHIFGGEVDRLKQAEDI